MSETYLLVINGKPEGPFSLEQLKQLGIKPGDFLKTGDMDDFKEAHEIAELRQFLGIHQQALIPQYFASFDQRLLASALDWFFVSGACIVVAFTASLFDNNKTFAFLAFVFLIAAIPIINLIYHIIMEASAKQGTYGKQILRIKVCDLQGYPISFAHSAGRNLARLVSIPTLFTGYLFSFFTKQQQCLHDIIAGTLVMKDRLI